MSMSESLFARPRQSLRGCTTEESGTSKFLFSSSTLIGVEKTHRVNFFVFTRMSSERFISFTYDLNLLFTRIFLSAGEQLYEVYCVGRFM